MMGTMDDPRRLQRSRLTVVAALRMESLVIGGAVVRCGMGPVRSAACGAGLAQSLAPDAPVAIVGVCGALSSDLTPGMVIVADEVSRTDGTATTLPHSAAVARILSDRGVAVRVGRMVSVARLVRGGRRQELAIGGAIAVDMESEPLVRALSGHPIVVVRAVADTPDAGLVGGGLRGLLALRRIRPALAIWEDTIRRDATGRDAGRRS